jgi:RNA exonuclease 4
LLPFSLQLSDETLFVNMKTMTENNNNLRREHDELNIISDSSSVSSSSENGERRRKRKKKKTKKQKREPEDPVMKVESEMNLSEEEKRKYVALDCEMVGSGYRGKRSVLARVTIVDWNHNVLFDEYVKPEYPVTDYRTFVSGITPEILDQAQLDLHSCRQQVSEILKGRILVGHALKNDMRALGISHPWQMMRDTAKYEPFMKARFDDGILWPQSLKTLSKNKLRRDIQVTGKAHCPVEDAVSAMDLYKVARHKWEQAMDYKIQKTLEIERRQQ